jgi:alpha-1,6-mannosyltransferase
MHADPVGLCLSLVRRGGDAATIDKAFERYWRHLRRLDERYDMIVSASASLSDRLTPAASSMW